MPGPCAPKSMAAFSTRASNTASARSTATAGAGGSMHEQARTT